MDEMNAFEKQLASVVLRRVGPSQPVDDLAIYESITAATVSPRRGITVFTALKFVTAAAVVALFGGFLLAGILSAPQGEEVLPGAGTESPSPLVTTPAQPFAREAIHVTGSLANWAGTFDVPGTVAGAVTSDARLEGCYVAQSAGGSASGSWGTVKVYDRCGWVWPDEHSVKTWEGGWFVAGQAPGRVSIYGHGLGTVWLDGLRENEGWSASLQLEDGTIDGWLFPTPETATLPPPFAPRE